MYVKNLKQSVTIRASPKELYNSIVDPVEHARFTGARAKLEQRVGGRFDHYDGDLEGVVVDLRPHGRIVLAWRSNDWPEGHYSIANFRFSKSGRRTRLDFEQYGIPAEHFEDISDGWRQFYWDPLKAFFES